MRFKAVFYFLFLSVFMLFTSCENTLVFHDSHESKRQNTPFSDAVETDDFFFLSGQIGRDHSTGILAEGIQEQTKQVIENIENVLKYHNSSLDRVVKCTVILKNIEDFQAFNEVYKQYFTNKPARTTFSAAGLAANALIEIDVIVTK